MNRRFKVRDLMIQVLPDEADLGGGTPAAGCGACTLCSQCSNCSVATCFETCGLTCGACTIVTMPGCGVTGCGCSCSCYASIGISVVLPLAAGPGRSLDILWRLKDQLRAALGQINEQENQLVEGMRPRTLEDVDLLEKKLGEAQEDLRKRRQQLEHQEED